MISLKYTSFLRRLLLLALPLAIGLMLLFPGVSEAHSILLKSDPTRGAVLATATAPAQVRMWFSEDLNPAISKAFVINAANQRVDVNGSLVVPDNVREMDVSLKPNRPPDVYVVVYRTQSAADGHVLSGSFIFTIANPDGSIPQTKGALPGQNAFGDTSAASTGQFNGTTLFNLLMVTLVEIGVVFWVGGQLWRSFVLQLSDEEDPEQRAIEQQAEQRFERRFSQPVLRLLFFANIGVLLGQALSVTGGDWGQIFSFSLLSGLVANGHFGVFWVIREVVIVLAMVVGAYSVLARKRPGVVNSILPWANLVLALALLIAVTLSGHAAAVSGPVGIYAILVDWLHLLAASLWVGGMMYISLIYLPVLKNRAPLEQTHSLLTTLPRFSPMAIAGVIIMSISGPFNATVHMSSVDQLYTTAYGRALVVKVLLVGSLLITSAIHVGLFRPRLARTYKKYRSLSTQSQEKEDLSASAVEVKFLENSVSSQTARLSKVLRWEPLLGVAVLVCAGLMTIFAGTLAPVTPNQPATQQQTAQAKPYTTTVKTDDGLFTVNLSVSPNRFGPNTFTVKVQDSKGQADTNVGVSLYTTMLDMDMGTASINLQPDGKGGFSANDELSMSGNWQIRIQIRTPDNTLHETKVKFVTQ